MKTYSPDVFQTSLLGDRMAVFCGASGNKFIFSTGNKFVQAWWPRSLKQALLFPETHDNSYNEESCILRSFLRDFLRAEALKDYIPVMDSMAKEHLEAEWLPYKEVKVFPQVKTYIFALACRMFMSIKDPVHVKRVKDLFDVVAAGVFSLPVNIPGTAFNRAFRGGKIMREEFLAIIKQRRSELLENKGTEEAGMDLMSRMLLGLDHDHQEGGTLDEMKIANRIMGLLIAGYDTTTISLTAIVNYLAENPNIYDKVLREQMEIAKSKIPGELLNWGDVQKMKYAWCVACESMRLSPPVQGTFKEVTTDFTYAGFIIPKGWKTHWTVHSTYKDPKYFPDPGKFDPSRFEGQGPPPYTFVPFAGGPRMCPGKEYARFEILVFVHNLVTKFQWEKVIPDEKIIYIPNVTPENGLPVRLLPHQNYE
ncbi:beta-amyrin 6-beta-monooxygenase isoform X1 [Ricinus communis]|nr:beta-amyrin 6-beta-monooxygenase isoform X1 [Ricinus communis]XP_048226633.1 beta-amyrin 6-beta-monooxygenase isoform X1 [Ricinus communis]